MNELRMDYKRVLVIKGMAPCHLQSTGSSSSAMYPGAPRSRMSCFNRLPALHYTLDPSAALPILLCVACPLNAAPVFVAFDQEKRTNFHHAPKCLVWYMDCGGIGRLTLKHGDTNADYSRSVSKMGDFDVMWETRGAEVLMLDKRMREVRTVVLVPADAPVRQMELSRNGQSAWCDKGLSFLYGKSATDKEHSALQLPLLKLLETFYV